MSYSDNGIDQRVAEIFDTHIGHACDVGANDGRFNSNTLSFEERGWTVLCVEPNPLLAESGRERRKLWREVACGAADEDCVDFGVCGPMMPYPSRSSLGTQPRDSGGPAEKVVKVMVRTLDRLLEEAGFPRLDYLTVDVEGWERDVMAGFTVERWKPRVIVLEEWTDNAIVIPGYTVVERRLYDNLYVRD